MKAQYKIALFFTVVTFITGALQAQNENSRERLIDQLKKGTAPGLRFAPVAPAAPVQKDDMSELQKKESLPTQIRKGTAPKMQFQAGGGANARTTSAGSTPVKPKAAVKPGTLPSESALPKLEPRKPIVAPIPVQEEPAKQ